MLIIKNSVTEIKYVIDGLTDRLDTGERKYSVYLKKCQ